jgi:hypothetical protein
VAASICDDPAAMRRLYRVMRLDFLPWPLVFAVAFLVAAGLDVLTDGTIGVKAAIFAAAGATIGVAIATKRRQSRR